jgi:hypothetical protein
MGTFGVSSPAADDMYRWLDRLQEFAEVAVLMGREKANLVAADFGAAENAKACVDIRDADQVTRYIKVILIILPEPEP